MKIHRHNLLALVVVAITLTSVSACTATIGRSNPAPASSSTSAAVVAPVATTSAAGPATVTVAPPPSKPKKHVVTRTKVVVENNGSDQSTTQVSTPGDSSSLLAVYDSAMGSDSSIYYGAAGAGFTSPSGNIACYIYEDGSAACSIHSYEFDQPGPDCDAGIAAQMDAYGTPSLSDCAGYFSVHTGAATLPYGESVSYGDTACVSESTGISCLDTDTDTGFTVSREAFTPVYG